MIYLLITEDDKYVKIGFTSKENKSRKHFYTTHSPYDLKLALFIPGGIEYERELHTRFYQYRKRNEWYYFAPEISQFIKNNIHLNIEFSSRKAVNQSIIDGIGAMYQDGLPVSEIADKYQRTIKAIKRVLERNKIKRVQVREL